MPMILPLSLPAAPPNPILVDRAAKTIALKDGRGDLALRLSWGKGLLLDRMKTGGRLVAHRGWTGAKVGQRWWTSEDSKAAPRIAVKANRVEISGIVFGPATETWTFDLGADTIRWTVDRTYRSAATLDDVALPKIAFDRLDTWKGALLGTGGVAWAKLFDAPNATYGVHTQSATFWSGDHDACLRLGADGSGLRFTREPEGAWSISQETGSLVPRHGKARFLKDRQDVWEPVAVRAGQTVRASVLLSSPSYRQSYGRGDFKGLDTRAVTELTNTIGRIGVIDDRLVGSNGWYSGYICLHEPWIARMGIAIDDPLFTRNYARALDDQRDHALQSDGMMLSRWTYGDYDAKPGTYNRFGYYEAQWGRLMDTQTSYAANVADQFDATGDFAWLRGQKATCEAVLGYLLRRDANGNHLVEMENESHTQRRSSDWLDIVWASHENALVNAELYRALLDWSRLERLLGDAKRSAYYGDFAAKLKASFNRPIEDGGFWDEKKGWYVYWRDADGSVHGDNLVSPVNLLAVAEGLCDDPGRRERLLTTMESRRQAEELLTYPSCYESYAPGEGKDDRFPVYENGDVFLAWAECGIRVYAETKPQVAFDAVRRIVAQYGKDGLAFQRYLRSNGQGAGDDILANNANAIVGLYRDIYGIQPKYNRLCLAPRLVPQAAGTRVDYDLRGKRLHIDLSPKRYAVGWKGLTLASKGDFGVDFAPGRIVYFAAQEDEPTLTVSAPAGAPLRLEAEGRRTFRLAGGARPVRARLTLYRAGALYAGGERLARVSADHSTKIEIPAGRTLELQVRP